MKNNQIKVLLLTACMITAFAGCSYHTSEKNADIQEKHTLDLSEAREEKLDLENYSLAYNMQTDAQPFFQLSRVAKSEYGYYFWEAEPYGRMMFYDAEADQYVPLCSRPDCAHNSPECNAYFNAAGEPGVHFERSYIQYYDGSIYIIGYDTEYRVNLYKIAADGSSWENFMQLYQADMSSPSGEEGDNSTYWIAPDCCVHRDYIYYIDNRESVPKIRRMRLGSSEAEVVYESTGERAMLYRMEAYGDYLFFQTGNAVDEDYEEIKTGIAAYNTQTGEICMVKWDAINVYVVKDDILYYTTKEGIRSFSLLTQEDKLVLNTSVEYAEFLLDEQYIYTYDFWNKILEIYDCEGNFVCRIEDDNVWNCYFGDTEYLFASASKEGEAYKVILDISKIAEGNAEWEKIY